MASSPKKARTLSCISCKLLEGCESPKMEPYGEFKKKILVIGEAPGKVEDRKGMPWQGRAGRLLQRYMSKAGISLFEDCISINSVNCRPPDNRTPTKFEIDCCRKVMVEKVIEEYKPRAIFLMGATAVQSLLSPRWGKDLGGITKWRGFQIPDQDLRAWVFPILHPAYLLRMDSREVNTVFDQDIQNAAATLQGNVPVFKYPEIHILDDLSPLREFREAEDLAIDYETTGLKAQVKGQRIICAGVCASEDEAYAFMMPKTRAERKPFMDLLTSDKVGKMGHNIKYENSWTFYRYGVEVRNWQWDSMLAAHHLDNRTGVTNLKFQTYANFGVIIKDEDVAKYIYEKQDDNLKFNKVYELLEQPGGMEKLLRHVALDAYWEYMLAKKQMKELDYQYLPF